MRLYYPVFLLACFLLIPIASVNAASRNFSGYNFTAYIQSNSHIKQPSYQNQFIYVQENQEYSIVVNNPLPVRVGVAVSVDGLNTVDGKSTSPAKAAKWIIQPYSSITIPGWQTGNNNLRKFVFKKPQYTYASWREKRDGVRYSQNLGVIGIAYFWDSAELHNAINHSRRHLRMEDRIGVSPLRKKRIAPPESVASDGQAGTGMGRREYHPVYSVAFNFDAGMYSSKDVLTIRYGFNSPRDTPRPFREEPYRYEHRQFSPEMPQY